MARPMLGPVRGLLARPGHGRSGHLRRLLRACHNKDLFGRDERQNTVYGALEHCTAIDDIQQLLGAAAAAAWPEACARAARLDDHKEGAVCLPC